MSRLDYVTMAIVAACILAIIFLLYKMTDLFQGGKKPANSEISADSVELDDEEVYDYEIDEAVDSAGSAASDHTAPAKPATGNPSAPATAPEMDAATSPAEDDAEVRTTAAAGQYLVIAGSFDKKANAERAVKNLVAKGYKEAVVEIMDRGRFAVALAGRFDTQAEAAALSKELNAKGIKAFVKRQAGTE